ncbi:hypothetical protein ACFLXQ_07815 [Chloroflexota bacterium]
MSQIPHLYYLCLPAGEWVAAIEGVNKQSSLKYLYAEEPADIHLIDYQQPSPDWTEGRAFGQAVEVRWSRRRDGYVDLTLLTEKSFASDNNWQPCALTTTAPDDELSVKEGQIMLLGVSRRHQASPYPYTSTAPKEWTDSRIPRPLVYPLPDEQTKKRWVKVIVKTYCLNDRPVITRMAALEGSDDDETKKL